MKNIMNLIENYILEVYLEEPCKVPFEDDPKRPWVHVKFKVDSYGRTEIEDRYFPKYEWEAIKKKGWYLA